MTKITEQQIDRVIELGKTVWENLSKDEQEKYYYDDGTIAFVENILSMLHLEKTIIDYATFDTILENVTNNVKATEYQEYLVHVNVKVKEELLAGDYYKIENAINEVLGDKLSPRGAEITLVDEL